MTTETEAEALKREIAGLSPHKQTRRYTPELRARVLKWARERLAGGASVAALCAEVGIGEPTLHRFLGHPRTSERRRRKPGFAQMKVAASKAAAPANTVLLRGPCGVTVEGLTVEALAKLLKGLSCSG